MVDLPSHVTCHVGREGPTAMPEQGQTPPASSLTWQATRLGLHTPLKPTKYSTHSVLTGCGEHQQHSAETMCALKTRHNVQLHALSE
jgi:hypothetical protein